MRCDGGPRKRKRLGLTPLVDVVFLLLVFFMLANRPIEAPSLSVSLSHGSPPVPEEIGATGNAAEAPDSEPRVQLIIDADGTLLLANEPVSEQDLPDRLRALPRSAGDTTLSLVPHPDLPLQRLVELLDVAAAAGVESTALHRNFGE